jgi:hypothetical protein
MQPITWALAGACFVLVVALWSQGLTIDMLDADLSTCLAEH